MFIQDVIGNTTSLLSWVMLALLGPNQVTGLATVLETRQFHSLSALIISAYKIIFSEKKKQTNKQLILFEHMLEFKELAEKLPRKIIWVQYCLLDPITNC